MMIQEAWKRILEIRGERETKFGIEFWHYRQIPGRPVVKVSLWDGERHYYAENLEDLIKLAEVSVGEPGVIDGELPEIAGKKEGQGGG